MANEIQWRHSVTGAYLNFTVRNTSGQYWYSTGPAFETCNLAHWLTYNIGLAESPSGSYLYFGTFPSGVSAGWYWVDIFSSIASYGQINDGVLAQLFGYWTGSVFKYWAADVIQIAGTPQTARDIGASVLLSVGMGTGQVNLSSGKVPATLSATDVSGNVAADLQTIKTQTVTCSAGVTVSPYVGNATHAIVVDASGNAAANLVNIAGSAVATGTAQLGVNLVNIAGSAVSTTTAQLGVNVVKYNNQTATTDAGNLPKVDLERIAGAALNTATAQIGVNVVNWAGAATSTDGIYPNVNAAHISSVSPGVITDAQGGISYLITYPVGGGGLAALVVSGATSDSAVNGTYYENMDYGPSSSATLFSNAGKSWFLWGDGVYYYITSTFNVIGGHYWSGASQQWTPVGLTLAPQNGATGTVTVSQMLSSADLQTIKGQSVTCGAGVTVGPYVGNATHAITVDGSGNVTFNNTTIATATNLTNLPSIPNNWLTAAGIASAALNGKGDWITAGTGSGQLSVSGGVAQADVAKISGTSQTAGFDLTQMFLMLMNMNGILTPAYKLIQQGNADRATGMASILGITTYKDTSGTITTDGPPILKFLCPNSYVLWFASNGDGTGYWIISQAGDVGTAIENLSSGCWYYEAVSTNLPAYNNYSPAGIYTWNGAGAHANIVVVPAGTAALQI